MEKSYSTYEDPQKLQSIHFEREKVKPTYRDCLFR